MRLSTGIVFVFFFPYKVHKKKGLAYGRLTFPISIIIYPYQPRMADSEPRGQAEMAAFRKVYYFSSRTAHSRIYWRLVPGNEEEEEKSDNSSGSVSTHK